MNKQETFNIVVQGLRKQGKKSTLDGANSVCRYRGDGGTKCSGGLLIPDELYDIRYEGQRIQDSLVVINKYGDDTSCSAVTELLYGLGHYLPLVSDLQGVHDNDSVDKWEAGFARVAERYWLIVPPIQEVLTNVQSSI